MSINATLIAQAVVFVLFVLICWKYVYPPILSVMKEREKRISDGLEAAKKADDSLEEAKLAFDKELNQAKEEAAQIVDKANSRASLGRKDAGSGGVRSKNPRINRHHFIKSASNLTAASASFFECRATSRRHKSD